MRRREVVRTRPIQWSLIQVNIPGHGVARHRLLLARSGRQLALNALVVVGRRAALIHHLLMRDHLATHLRVRLDHGKSRPYPAAYRCRLREVEVDRATRLAHVWRQQYVGLLVRRKALLLLLLHLPLAHLHWVRYRACEPHLEVSLPDGAAVRDIESLRGHRPVVHLELARSACILIQLELV
jgi:hypothetical protein